MAKARRAGGVKRVEGSFLTPETLMALVSQLGASRIGSAVDAAQEVMFDAWECDDPKKRIALARKALKISPLCADAYVLLARETASTPEEALGLYVEAVTAGERALGKAAFKDDVGMFWGLIETRPYMRARQGLALAQWASGRREEAAEGARDMLRLNPNDNQGIRYLLVDWLLQLGRDEEAAALLKRYKDDGAEWLWPAVLACFRAKGDGAASRSALKRALGANAHVPAYLLGRKKLPRRMPDFVTMGGVDEAISYAEQAMSTWARTPGGLEWLAGTVGPKARNSRTLTSRRS
jgi:tetratricopeptide (TPR) repeat protein